MGWIDWVPLVVSGVAFVLSGVALARAGSLWRATDFEALGAGARARYMAQLDEVRAIASSIAGDVEDATAERVRAQQQHAAARRAEQRAEAAQAQAQGDHAPEANGEGEPMTGDDMARLLLSGRG